MDSEAYKKAMSSPELPVTSAVLLAAARHLGQACKAQNEAFVKCKADNNGDPSACLDQGTAVTTCAINFFRQMREHCGAELDAQWQCLDQKNQDFTKCRETQSALDTCVFEKLGLDGAFETYDTDRSKPSLQ